MRVKLVKKGPYAEHFTVGKVYEVHEVAPSGAYYIKDDALRHFWWLNSDLFEVESNKSPYEEP